MNMKIYSEQTLFHPLGPDRILESSRAGGRTQERRRATLCEAASGTSALASAPHPQPKFKLRQYRLRERPRNDQVAVLAMISAVPADVVAPLETEAAPSFAAGVLTPMFVELLSWRGLGGFCNQDHNRALITHSGLIGSMQSASSYFDEVTCLPTR
jgi:hypothetical protein